jgi:transcriptional regulator with XRE-family HTH domain
MNRVKELREEKKMRQVDLAAELNISQSTLSNWERSNHDPDNISLSSLARYFECSVDYLLMNTEIRLPLTKEKVNEEYINTALFAEANGISSKDFRKMVDFVIVARQKGNIKILDKIFGK